MELIKCTIQIPWKCRSPYFEPSCLVEKVNIRKVWHSSLQTRHCTKFPSHSHAHSDAVFAIPAKNVNKLDISVSIFVLHSNSCISFCELNWPWLWTSFSSKHFAYLIFRRACHFAGILNALCSTFHTFPSTFSWQATRDGYNVSMKILLNLFRIKKIFLVLKPIPSYFNLGEIEWFWKMRKCAKLQEKRWTSVNNSFIHDPFQSVLCISSFQVFVNSLRTFVSCRVCVAIAFLPCRQYSFTLRMCCWFNYGIRFNRNSEFQWRWRVTETFASFLHRELLGSNKPDQFITDMNKSLHLFISTNYKSTTNWFSLSEQNQIVKL